MTSRANALFTRGLVSRDSVGGVFAGTHEAVPGALVGNRLIVLAGRLHGCGGGRDGGVDASVVAGVEAVDRGGDGGHVRGAGTVKDEGGGKVFAMGGKGEGLAAAPAEADRGDFAVGCRKVLAVVGRGIEIGIHAVRVQTGDGFHRCVLAGEFAGPAAIGPETGEQVGGNDDEALCGQFVGHLLGPVAKAEDLVNEDDHGGFGFNLGVDHEGLNGTIAVLERHVLVVARRCFQAGFRPVLRMDGSGRERKKHSSGTASLRARGIVNCHGEEFSH